MRAGIAVADSSAGIYAATGILIALAERERSGVGQWVQTSLLEAQIALMDFQAARYLVDGVVPGQAGNDHPYSTPMGVFETSDGFINIGVGGDGQWRALCVALERPDLGTAPEYATLELRFHNRPKLTALLAEVFKTKSSVQWLERLEQQGVPAGPIYKLDEVFADPQAQHLVSRCRCIIPSAVISALSVSPSRCHAPRHGSFRLCRSWVRTPMKFCVKQDIAMPKSLIFMPAR